jgi:hypothetical protein
MVPAGLHRKKELLRRLLCAVAGLIAGDSVLLLVLSGGMRQMFPVYAAFSVLGWFVIALPVVIFVDREPLRRLPWPVVIVSGAILGVISLTAILFLIFLLQGRVIEFSFKGTGMTWLFAVIVSTVAFVVYAALLRRR